MQKHLVLNLASHVSLMVDEKLGAFRQQMEEKIHDLRSENGYLQDDIEKLRLDVGNNKEEIGRLRQANLEAQYLCSEVRQQNYELTRKYEDLQKEYEDLKQENEELYVRADQLSADIAYFKLREKERESVNSEALSHGHQLNVAAENPRACDRNTATYYEFNTGSDLELSQASSSGYLQDSDHQRNPSISGPPVTLIMSNYSAYSAGRARQEYWVSKPFYSGIQPSYKLCLSVRVSRNLSVYVRLMRGEFDDQLAWPFNANITIQLVNHGRGMNYQRIIPFQNGRRVTRGNRASGGRGDTDFITLFENSSFVNNDTLWFKVVSVKLI